MDTSQYLSMFLEESMENLQTLNEALLELEQNPNDLNMLNKIFRVAHTIKGMAATMGFSYMAELTHKMEDVLSNFRDGKLEVTEDVVTVLFHCLDKLESMVNCIEEGSEYTGDVTDIVSELDVVVSGGNNSSSVAEVIVSDNNVKNGFALNEYDISIVKEACNNGYSVFGININLNADTLLKGVRAFLILQELEAQGEIIKSIPSVEDMENEQFDSEIYFMLITKQGKNVIQQLVEGIAEVRKVDITEVTASTVAKKETVKEAPKVVEAKKSDDIKEKQIIQENKKEVPKDKAQATGKKAHQSVRVDIQRIDMLMNMVSELVIYRTRLEQIVMNNKTPELVETLEGVERTTSDLQELVMKIRMLPLDIVFNRFPRMIRDLSVDLGKDINFVIEGAETELDRTVIDEIGEPLIHLLRNAADHGVEQKEDRIKHGKSQQGTIKLMAYQEGTKAIIKVVDDGAGINIDKVKAKAERVGIDTSGLTDQQIKELIFHQGFSTNEVVTDISGRGVGMDVVKTKIQALGGTVDITSELGSGTSFIIKLPLTLQIIQALLVEVGDESFAISLGFVDRVIAFKEEYIKVTNGNEVVVYGDKIIPLIRLNEKLAISPQEDAKKYVIVVKLGEKYSGLLVDSLVGQQEIVIKPLGKVLKDVKEYIGATILGNGLVTLILDVGALI